MKNYHLIGKLDTDNTPLHVTSYQLIAGAEQSAVSGISQRGARITRLVSKTIAEKVARAIDREATVWLEKDGTVRVFDSDLITIDDEDYMGPSFSDQRCERYFTSIDDVIDHIEDMH